MTKKPEIIQVSRNMSVVVSGVGFQDGDKYVVHRVINSECDVREAVDIPFTPCGEVLYIDSTHNPLLLDMPGLYRLYPDGVVSHTAKLYTEHIYD